MDKRLQLQLNANRKISGVLRGYDAFMNIVLDEAVEEASATERRPIGMVVRIKFSKFLFVNSVLLLGCEGK